MEYKLQWYCKPLNVAYTTEVKIGFAAILAGYAPIFPIHFVMAFLEKPNHIHICKTALFLVKIEFLLIFKSIFRED